MLNAFDVVIPRKAAVIRVTPSEYVSLWMWTLSVPLSPCYITETTKQLTAELTDTGISLTHWKIHLCPCLPLSVPYTSPTQFVYTYAQKKWYWQMLAEQNPVHTEPFPYSQRIQFGDQRSAPNWPTRLVSQSCDTTPNLPWNLHSSVSSCGTRGMTAREEAIEP